LALHSRHDIQRRNSIPESISYQIKGQMRALNSQHHPRKKICRCHGFSRHQKRTCRILLQGEQFFFYALVYYVLYASVYTPWYAHRKWHTWLPLVAFSAHELLFWRHPPFQRRFLFNHDAFSAQMCKKSSKKLTLKLSHLKAVVKFLKWLNFQLFSQFLFMWWFDLYLCK
jgi:hypothetical protein